MFPDNFDHKIAAGLHSRRLAEAESIRLARNAKIAARETIAERAERRAAESLKRRIGRQLIALGERMSA